MQLFPRFLILTFFALNIILVIFFSCFYAVLVLKPEEISQNCIESQKERLFIQESTGGKPHWAFRFQPNDNERFIRNASAVGTKIKARYPFVEPTPFEK